jgi:hypothetical protein
MKGGRAMQCSVVRPLEMGVNRVSDAAGTQSQSTLAACWFVSLWPLSPSPSALGWAGLDNVVV